MYVSLISLEPDYHEVGVPLLALEPEPVVELDHVVLAVEGHLVAAELGRQEDGDCDEELAQLSAPILITYNNILKSKGSNNIPRFQQSAKNYRERMP